MPLKLFYITNRPDIAFIAQDAGVDRIFVDMEYIDKALRQGGMDTVQSHHTIEDIRKLRTVVNRAELLVRCNPVHERTKNYCSTEEEVDNIVSAGADIIMLPFFKTKMEVERFLHAVKGRCRTMLLFETPDSVKNADEILALKGIDEAYIGLNDLSIGYKRKFMFELLSDGTVENLCLKFRLKKLTYGFGGIAAIGTGELPAEAILREHYRLGSSMVILARSFCNYQKIGNIELVREKLVSGIRTFRAFESEIECHTQYFKRNRDFVADCIRRLKNT